MERIAVVDGLTLAAVLARIAPPGGGPVVLTHGPDDVAVVVRPDDLDSAATAYLLEAFERADLSDLLPIEGGQPPRPPARAVCDNPLSKNRTKKPKFAPFKSGVSGSATIGTVARRSGAVGDSNPCLDP